jgi:uncharacterized protein (TIGR02466 family)
MTGIIKGLFPTPVGIYTLERSFSKAEIETVKNIDYNQNQGNYSSQNTDILSLNSLASIKDFIEDAIEDYSKQTFVFTPDTKLYITQSWSNRSSTNEGHHLHRHPNSIISGCLYFDCNENDTVQFYRPMPYNFSTGSEDMNEYNSYSWWMPSVVGRLYIFPSTIDHSVPNVTGIKDRYSLAFNTFFKGKMGNKKMLTHLEV